MKTNTITLLLLTLSLLTSCGTNFTIPFNIADEAPYILECIAEETPEERKKCTTKWIQEFINKTIDVNLKKELNVEAVQSFIVTLLIKKNGHVKVINIDSSAPALNQHIIKVVESMGKFIPAKMFGKEVGSTYVLPIVY